MFDSFGSFDLSTRALYNHALSIVRRRRWHWHRHWRQHHYLYTPPLATRLDTEASYLVYICISMSII